MCCIHTGQSPKQTGGVPYRLDAFWTYSQSVDFLFIEAAANRILPPFRPFLACFWTCFGRIRANAAPPRLLIPIFARPAVLLRLLISSDKEPKNAAEQQNTPAVLRLYHTSRQIWTTPERERPQCVYFSPPPCPYPQQNRQTESLNHTKTAARLWKAARPRPFFWRVSSFRPLRRYIVSPAPYRAAVGKRPKASTKRDPPRPMQYRRARRVETIQTRAGDTTPPARANVDNIDTQTKAPPVWERPAWRPYAPPLNVDNTDNTQKRTPRRVEALPAPCVHIHAEEPKASTVTSAAPCGDRTPPLC